MSEKKQEGVLHLRLDELDPGDELDGMFALAIGVAEQRWPHTMDAHVWADEWLKIIAELPEVPTDREAMIGWFANAIMAGFDTAEHRSAGRRLRDFESGK